MRICGLAVEFCEGEGPGVREKGVEIVYGVKDCDEVKEGCYEADRILREDGFGNVCSWVGELFCEVRHAITVCCC